MNVGELRALLADADDAAQVLALVESEPDEAHRETAAEVDSDGDVIVTVLSW